MLNSQLQNKLPPPQPPPLQHQQQQHQHQQQQQLQLLQQQTDNNNHSYFIFDELSTALQERTCNNNNINNNNNNNIKNNHNNATNNNNNIEATKIINTSTTANTTASGVSVSSTTISSSSSSSASSASSTGGGSTSSIATSGTIITSVINQKHMASGLSQTNNQINPMSMHHSTNNNINMHQQQQKCGFGGDATYHFKTLVPAVAAGAIIGKGGETIAALQKETGARVKMSKAHDFYPGTSERVCLITGSVDAILTILDFIMEKIKEKPDLTTKLPNIEAKQAQERDKQVKILVPNSTAGMIIGKAGAFIKQIKEESGSYVQISQKPKDVALQERCITVIGEKDHNRIACKLILTKIIEDPESGTCLNVSYADINGPVANYNPTGSPYALNQNPINSSTASLNSALGNTVSGAGLLVNGTGLNLSLNLGSPNPSANPSVTTQLLDHIKMAMRGTGYSESVTTEVCAALGVLAKYGVLGVGVGLAHTNGANPTPLSYLGVSALDQSTNPSSVFGAIGQVNLDSYLGTSSPSPRTSLERYEAAFDPFRHAGTQAATPISLNNNSFGLATGGTTAQALGAAAAQSLGALSKSPTPGDVGTKETKNVEIPEVIVGAILGPGGRSLIEIQQISGANIQISKKGIFAPGTRNRIVTIAGQPNAITTAHFLIEQRIAEEEAKRARQTSLTGIMQ